MHTCTHRHTNTHRHTDTHTTTHTYQRIMDGFRHDTGPGRELLRSPTDAHLFQQQLLLQLPPGVGWSPILHLLLNLHYHPARHILHAALSFSNVPQKDREHKTTQALRLISHAFQHMWKPSAVMT